MFCKLTACRQAPVSEGGDLGRPGERPKKVSSLVGGCNFRHTFFPIGEDSLAFDKQEPLFVRPHPFTQWEVFVERNPALGFWDSRGGESTLQSLRTEAVSL